MSRQPTDARAGAFCPCCSGTGRIPDEHGDAWVDSTCSVCYGSGLNYPIDQLYTPAQVWAMRIVIGFGLLVCAVLAWVIL